MRESLRSKIDFSGDCWIWTGRIDKHGYGRFSSAQLVHRRVYTDLVGPIADGMTLDHVCHDPLVCEGGRGCPHRRCVNPAHLRQMTRLENQLRSYPAMKTHCKEGHPFDSENTYRRPDSDGARTCKACNRQAKARYRQRKREAACR